MIYVAVGRAVLSWEEASLVPVSVIWAAVSIASNRESSRAFRRSISNSGSERRANQGRDEGRGCGRERRVAVN